MDSSKRLWIYTGLGLVAGVGLVMASKEDQTSEASPAAPPRPVQQPSPVFPGARVLLVGDSLAQGLALPMRQLAVERGVDFKADGRVSTTIGQWAGQPWLGQDLTYKPTLILVSLGTNDMKLLDPSLERPALMKLSQGLRSSGAVIVWLAPPQMPFPDRGVRALLTEPGFKIFPSDALNIQRGPDQIHPTTVGYAGWSGAIWSWLGGRPQAFGGLRRKFPSVQRSR